MNPCPSVLETTILPLNYFPKMIKYVIEIKYRIISIFIAIATSMLTLMRYRYYVINLFLETCPNLYGNTIKYFILTSVTELFDVFFNTWLFIMYHIMCYFTCYHIISFMSLGLYKEEYENLKYFFMSSVYLWITSIYIFLKILLPMTFLFFFQFEQQSNYKHFKLYFEPKLDTYLNFTINIYIQCYLIFQIILILVFLINYTRAVCFIPKFRRTIYIGVLIIATLITPPEIWSQIIIFLFLILTVEIYAIGNIFSINLNLIKNKGETKKIIPLGRLERFDSSFTLNDAL